MEVEKNPGDLLVHDGKRIHQLEHGNALADISPRNTLRDRQDDFEDNQPALTLATTDPPRMTARSKSLATNYHWFRSKLSESTVVVKYVPSNSNVANIFTKALPLYAFTRHRKMLCGW